MESRDTLVEAESRVHRAARHSADDDAALRATMERRKSYLGLTDADAVLLRSLLPLIEERASEVVRAFYDFLLAYPETRRAFTDEATVRRLQHLQAEYLKEVFSGQYDEAYCRRKMQIGETHYGHGIEPEWYEGAYHFYRRLLFPLVSDYLAQRGRSQEEICEALLAVSKVMSFDMVYALEAYFAAMSRELLSEKDQLHTLAGQLRQSNEALAELTEQLEAKVAERTAALEASQERLLQSEKMAAIGKTASQMAHEIRNPLSAIVLNLELLADELESFGAVDTAAAEDLLQRVLGAANRMNVTMREYLQVARLPKLRVEPSDVNSLVEEQMEFLRAELRQARVRVVLGLAHDLPPAMLDQEQFRNVLVNLVKNSLDAMPDGGELHVLTRHDGPHVAIVVRDTGWGIAPEEQDRIWQPLYTTKSKGLGMGLSYVREVVLAHRGQVRCESESGRGATFTILLPVHAADS
jgi:signal transduction histidine kinase